MKHSAEILQFPLKSTQCPSCEGELTSTRHERLEFDYGQPPQQVRLSAVVPVSTCEGCGFSFTGEAAEVLIHEAVCRHLGVMTPSEIKGVREQLGLSRSDFAKLTRLGEASLARWERGSLVQNCANDQLLYLMRFPDNVDRLRLRRQEMEAVEDRSVQVNIAAEGVVRRFRALEEPDRLRAEASKFSLCKKLSH
jgi:putative zinc finger/helix-turn-helix YgiT family protein